MQNDRPITISVASTCKALDWRPQHMHWSEFVAMCDTPARGSETLADYLQMPKAQQDRLKDVGGYVGGTLAGPRRKATAVQSRDLITLDLDAIPSMGTDGVLKQLDALGCAYVVYSTRKHEPTRPRLRVVCPVIQNKEILVRLGGENPFYGAPTLVLLSARQTPYVNIEFFNAGCIMENMFLAATELGLGSVFISGASEAVQEEPELLSALELPSGYFPVAAVALG